MSECNGLHVSEVGSNTCLDCGAQLSTKTNTLEDGVMYFVYEWLSHKSDEKLTTQIKNLIAESIPEKEKDMSGQPSPSQYNKAITEIKENLKQRGLLKDDEVNDV